ncbi:hypothetical protein KI387_019033, partial [Taxus chinensis]
TGKEICDKDVKVYMGGFMEVPNIRVVMGVLGRDVVNSLGMKSVDREACAVKDDVDVARVGMDVDERDVVEVKGVDKVVVGIVDVRIAPKGE